MSDVQASTGNLPPSQHWVLDKRVNIGFLFAIFMQTVGLIIFVTQLNSRVGTLEARMISVNTDLTSSDKESREISNRLVRLEERTSNMLEILKDIKRYVDKRDPT